MVKIKLIIKLTATEDIAKARLPKKLESTVDSFIGSISSSCSVGVAGSNGPDADVPREEYAQVGNQSASTGFSGQFSWTRQSPVQNGIRMYLSMLSLR